MNDNTTPESFSDRFEERLERRHERRDLRYGGGSWILGIVLIIVGALFYLQTMNIYILHNWWALFILIPALGSFVAAWRVFRTDQGRFTRRARGSLIVGVGLLLVTVVFLLGLNWAVFGPILLVLAGVSLVINALFPN